MKTELNNSERVTRLFLALLIGSLIWVLAINQENFSVTEKLPFLLNFSENYCILEQSSDSMEVVFHGNGWKMLSFQLRTEPREITKNISLNGNPVFPVQQLITIDATEISINNQMPVRQIQPNQLTILIDTIITKRLPVAVITSDGIPSRYRNITVDPGFITITGPSATVLQMDSITTAPVNIISGTASIHLAEANKNIEMSRDIVQITVVEPIFPLKDF